MCDSDRIAALEDALVQAHKRLQNALGALADMVNQHCTIVPDGRGNTLDSMALSANAWAMEILGEEDRIVIEPPIVGRRVIARWKEKA